MNKYICALLAAALIFLCSFCASFETAQAAPINIVATTYPIYDWVSEILGDNPADIELTLLLDSGVDLHSFQPTAADIMKVASCDLFIYIGGESDEWVDDALGATDNDGRIELNLLEALGDAARVEEEVDGMQAEEEEDEGEEEPELDEHIWLSLRNAEALTETIADAIAQLDPANAELYRANQANYAAKLSALDAEYAAAVAEAGTDTLLFGDRFPFRYMVEDYGLKYYAAFSGCSAETEASFETVIFLAQKLDELGLKYIMTIDGGDQRIAETIRLATADKDQVILTMDSLQSSTLRDAEEGKSYLAAMAANLEALKLALSAGGV